VLALDEEKARIDALPTGLVTQTAPQLLELHGVGIDTASARLSIRSSATSATGKPPCGQG
jgi:hypothetical protein